MTLRFEDYNTGADNPTNYFDTTYNYNQDIDLKKINNIFIYSLCYINIRNWDINNVNSNLVYIIDFQETRITWFYKDAFFRDIAILDIDQVIKKNKLKIVISKR